MDRPSSVRWLAGWLATRAIKRSPIVEGAENCDFFVLLQTGAKLPPLTLEDQATEHSCSIIMTPSVKRNQSAYNRLTDTDRHERHLKTRRWCRRWCFYIVNYSSLSRCHSTTATTEKSCAATATRTHSGAIPHSTSNYDPILSIPFSKNVSVQAFACSASVWYGSNWLKL